MHHRILFVAASLTIAGGAAAPAEAAGMRNPALPNPASAYCVSVKGRLEIRQQAQGQTGYCRLPDGRVIEEWKLFRAQQKRPQPARP